MGFFDRKKEKSNLPTQTMLGIRVIVAGYILYLSYDLFKTRDASTMPFGVLIAVLALFVICSVFIIVHSIYLYAKGMYAGGKADVPAPPEEAEEVSEEIADEVVEGDE